MNDDRQNADPLRLKADGMTKLGVRGIHAHMTG
jgi:hypothetical protein